MKARIQTQSGFSLVELMIVVAIIGILATIAVPNFNRFSGKAKQSEAKSALASIYIGEKAFYGEWSTYIGDLRDIGYAPEGKMNYHVGFKTNGVPTTPGYTNVTQGNVLAAGPVTATTCIDSSVPSCFNVVMTPAASTAVAFDESVTLAQNAFSAAAGSNLGGAVNDYWKINASKNLAQVNDGLN